MKKITLFLGSILTIANIFGGSKFYGPPALAGRIADTREIPVNWPANVTYLELTPEQVQTLKMHFNYQKHQDILYIEKASNPAMGLGVFAKTSIPADTIIGVYLGEIHCKSEKDNHNQGSTYVMQLNDSTHIDAKSAGNETRFLNHNHNPSEIQIKIQSISVNGQNMVLMKTTKPIQKNQELFYDYGIKYWESHFQYIYHTLIETKDLTVFQKNFNTIQTKIKFLERSHSRQNNLEIGFLSSLIKYYFQLKSPKNPEQFIRSIIEEKLDLCVLIYNSIDEYLNEKFKETTEELCICTANID